MTSGLLQEQIRQAGEKRGFAVARLLTHWCEIVGEDTASVTLPVKVGFSHAGLGATLTILTTGAQAPMVQADLPRIKDKVNACYGYAAISKIRITQTAATGFSEGAIAFGHKKAKPAALPNVELTAKARKSTKKIEDNDLRAALEALGQNVLSRTERKGTKK